MTIFQTDAVVVIHQIILNSVQRIPCAGNTGNIIQTPSPVFYHVPMGFLLFVPGKISGMPFCVDSGLQMFIILATTVDKFQSTHFTLYVTNRSLIHTYSERYLQLNLGQRWIYDHLFIVAYINNSILIEFFAQV